MQLAVRSMGKRYRCGRLKYSATTIGKKTANCNELNSMTEPVAGRPRQVVGGRCGGVRQRRCDTRTPRHCFVGAVCGRIGLGGTAELSLWPPRLQRQANALVFRRQP